MTPVGERPRPVLETGRGRLADGGVVPRRSV